jgi:hypothetical protein
MQVGIAWAAALQGKPGGRQEQTLGETTHWLWGRGGRGRFGGGIYSVSLGKYLND